MESPLPETTLLRLAPLPRRFYQRETQRVARDLLGKVLLRRSGDEIVALRLIEAEAYLGVGDAAAHTFGGRRTPRNATMWGDGGHLYVYFTYGMHHCCNAVTRTPEVPEAVLLRGGVAVAGRAAMAARRGGRDGLELADGPAKLCQALAIDRTDDGTDLTDRGGVWIADDGFSVPDEWIVTGPRIGVGYAGEAAQWPLRWRVDLARSVPPAR